MDEFEKLNSLARITVLYCTRIVVDHLSSKLNLLNVKIGKHWILVTLMLFAVISNHASSINLKSFEDAFTYPGAVDSGFSLGKWNWENSGIRYFARFGDDSVLYSQNGEMKRVLPSGIPDSQFRVGADYKGRSGKMANLKNGNIVLSLNLEKSGRYYPHLVEITPQGTFAQKSQTLPSPFTSLIYAQRDGRILVSGENGLGRFNKDLTLDVSFHGYTNNRIETIIEQPDGKLIIGGGFTEIDSVPRNGLARLHPDGKLDESYNPNYRFEFPYQVNSIFLQGDGKLLVSGLMLINNEYKARLMRLDQNGTIDSSYTFPFSGGVQEIKEFSSNDPSHIYAGGATSIERLKADGNLDPEFKFLPLSNPYGSLVPGVLERLSGDVVFGTQNLGLAALFPDGQIIKNFNIAGPRAVSDAKISPDGRLIISPVYIANPRRPQPFEFPKMALGLVSHSGLISPVRPNADFYTEQFGFQGDKTILLWRSGVYQGLIRLNSNGEIDSSFVPPERFRLAWGSIATMEVARDGSIYVGSRWEEQPLVKLKPSGEMDTNFFAKIRAFGPAISLIRELPDERILISGMFNMINGKAWNTVAIIDKFGQNPTLNVNIQKPVNPIGSQPTTLNDAIMLPNGTFLLAGDFAYVQGEEKVGLEPV